jgi:hypothetical protein
MLPLTVNIAGFPIVEFSVISPESKDRLTFGSSGGRIGAEDRGELAMKAFGFHADTSRYWRFLLAMIIVVLLCAGRLAFDQLAVGFLLQTIL